MLQVGIATFHERMDLADRFIVQSQIIKLLEHYITADKVQSGKGQYFHQPFIHTDNTVYTPYIMLDMSFYSDLEPWDYTSITHRILFTYTVCLECECDALTYTAYCIFYDSVNLFVAHLVSMLDSILATLTAFFYVKCMFVMMF